MTYKQYLQSDKWKELRKKAFERALKNANSTNKYGICEVCGYKPQRDCLQVHHKEYPEQLGTESIDSLLIICGKCHAKIHNIDIRSKTEQTKKVRKNKMQKVEYWIEKRLGVLADNGKNTRKELNLVSWNKAEAVVDLRGWFSDEKGNRKPLKGICLSREEAKTLATLLNDFFDEEEKKTVMAAEENERKTTNAMDGFLGYVSV